MAIEALSAAFLLAELPPLGVESPRELTLELRFYIIRALLSTRVILLLAWGFSLVIVFKLLSVKGSITDSISGFLVGCAEDPGFESGLFSI